MKRMAQMQGKGCMEHKCSLPIPPRTLEAAVWEDALRALAVAMVDASFDMDTPEGDTEVAGCCDDAENVCSS